MRVTEKGQVTIPKHIREKLGIKPGSEVEFVEAADGIRVRRASDTEMARAVAQLEDWIGKVAGSGRNDLTVDDIMVETRGRRLGNPH